MGAVDKNYSLLCGVFLYEAVADEQALVNWIQRIENAEAFRHHLKRTYYENYLTNIFNETETGFSHFTLKQFLDKVPGISFNETTVQIPYFDVYLFKDGIGIFAFKASYFQNIGYEGIGNSINHLRNIDATFRTQGNQIRVIDWIGDILKSAIALKPNWSEFITQLKTYTIIDDLKAPAFSDTLDKVLFDLAHVSPMDEQKSLLYKPSDEYFKKVLKENTVSVFANWKAIALFDTFTRISIQQTDSFKTWENDYFLIYVHCLYTKFQLYLLNNQLRDLLIISNQTSALKSKFIEFVNDYNLAYISYKFLPNLLYEKITNSLDTQKELEKMEIKVERINEAYQARKSQQLNRILLVISVFSVISVVTDMTQWLTHLGVSTSVVYSLSVALMIASLVSAFYLIKKRWKV